MVYLFNFATGEMESASPEWQFDPGEACCYVPQDPIAQNLLSILMLEAGYRNTSEAREAVATTLKAVAGRQPDGVGELGEWANQEWMSIPLKPGTVAGVVCQHCGGFAQIEQTIDAAPIDIVYHPETVYRAADQVGPVTKEN